MKLQHYVVLGLAAYGGLSLFHHHKHKGHGKG